MRTGRMKPINARNVIEMLSCSARSVQVRWGLSPVARRDNRVMK